MNSLHDVWESVLSVVTENMTATAAKTWFGDTTAIELTENTLVIHTPTEYKQGIIMTRYKKMLEDALRDLFSADIQLVVIAGDEIEKYTEDKTNPFQSTIPEVAGYTFDNYVVGPSNKFVFAAANAVADQPGTLYNPLFIYGNSGLGKTHLMLAAGQSFLSRFPNARLVYVKGDDFTNELVQSIRAGTTQEFRDKYRKADMLLMDDIQFIAGKDSTQEEFFHTFNALYESHKQIIVTSDRPPMEMNRLQDRIRSRMEGGLITEVLPPDLETRMAITRKKASQLGMILSDEVVEHIAEKVTSNVRQLEGVVKKLTAFQLIMEEGEIITVDSVDRAISDVIRQGNYIPTPSIIIRETGRYYGVSEENIRGQSRQKNISMARHMSMYLCRTLTNLPLADIGKEFENRNHTTVLASIAKIEEMMKTSPEIVSAVRDITSNINCKN